MNIDTIWYEQLAYNKIIRQIENNDDKSYWTEKYLLGLVSEIDEVLREIKWKRHRRSNSVTLREDNIGLELADLFKYVLCLFDIWGFSKDQMLDIVQQKGRMLDFKLRMEFRQNLPIGSKVAIIDIDGVVADLNSSFAEWARDVKGLKISEEDLYKSTKQDQFIPLNYPDYASLKTEFEFNGGYRNLKAYPDAIIFVNKLRYEEVFIIFVTSRPVSRQTRIFFDTWSWLLDSDIPFDEIHIEEEDRIILADKLMREGCRVAMFDDNPEIINRAFRSNIPIFAREHPYNFSLPLSVRKFKSFSQLAFEDIWRSDV